MSLLCLPTELLHSIFDKCDIETILFSVRASCKRLYVAVNVYDRFHFTIRPESLNVMKAISGLIQPEQIISLNISTGGMKVDGTDLFTSFFDCNRLIRLRSITLNYIGDIKMIHFLQKLSSNSLDSFSTKSQYMDEERWTLLSSTFQRWNLRKLCMNDIDFRMENISWPDQFKLEYLTIGSCTCIQYLAILSQLSYLKTLIIHDFSIGNMNNALLSSNVPTVHPSLMSLIITRRSITPDNLIFLLSPVPSLRHFKLISQRKTFDPMLDSSCFEQIIQTKLPAINKFEFFFFYEYAPNDDVINLASLIAPFRTSYWIDDKRWFVSCAYVPQSNKIWLHTMPINIPSIESQPRVELSCMDNICRWTERPFNHMENTIIDEVCIKSV